jgi:hypothetical protein
MRAVLHRVPDLSGAFPMKNNHDLERAAGKSRPIVQPKQPFRPTTNWWTGQPHIHAREVARRLRQVDERAARISGYGG